MTGAELIILAWTAGATYRPLPVQYPSMATCQAAIPSTKKQLDKTLPENYTITTHCKPANRELTYRELAGKDGYRCFRFGEGCGSTKHIDVDVNISVEDKRRR